MEIEQLRILLRGRAPPRTLHKLRRLFEEQYGVRLDMRPPRHVRDCAVCGSTFLAARPEARYCSNAHRQRAYRERRHI
jgi:hypothetical protein